MTAEQLMWLRLAKEHQRRANRCSAKLRETHRERSESHPDEYVTVRLVNSQ